MDGGPTLIHLHPIQLLHCHLPEFEKKTLYHTVEASRFRLA
jgi:hypothetical protein